MKALSLKQPWAELVASGRKTIETRTWTTKYRGPVLICAGKTWMVKASADLLGRDPRPDELGVAVAVADIVDVRPMTAEDEKLALCPSEPGRFAWVLSNIRRIRSFPMKGMLGLFDAAVPDGVL